MNIPQNVKEEKSGGEKLMKSLDLFTLKLNVWSCEYVFYASCLKN